MVICYGSNRKLTRRATSPEALQLHPSSDRELPPASASSHHYQIPPHGIQVVPQNCFPLCQLCPSGPPQNKPFQCLKVVFVGVIPPFPNSFLLCAYHPQNAFLIASPEIGEGNGTPFHYSCLENPMNGGAW